MWNQLTSMNSINQPYRERNHVHISIHDSLKENKIYRNKPNQRGEGTLQ